MQKELDEILAQVPFFEGMPADEIALIAGCGRNVHIDEGETIFRQGDAADVFYVLRHGTVAVGNFVPPRGELVIETLESGDLLGWSWLFPPYRWHFGASAVETTLALELDGPGVRSLCERDPALGYLLVSRFMGLVVERLQATRLRMLVP
jgi:CRP/FNR family transcriptional regulator, cyclic AMP receptor protein